ncbi:MAG: hypothetical protein MI922_29750 [Bacteroidales bacterium]|nr:hypothetical protein [Bacteroidales bacterium]
MRNILIYLKYLLKELISPINYILAFLIGFTINFFQGIGIFSSTVPFIVPIIVQSISKSGVKFKNRQVQTLVRLPQLRKDPTFVMKKSGEIVACDGITKSILEGAGIKYFKDIFSNSNKTDLQGLIVEIVDKEELYNKLLYSEVLDKWYEVNAKCDELKSLILIWLEDVSHKVELDEKLRLVTNFSKQLLISLNQRAYKDSSDKLLSEFILNDGYEAVFIANIDSKDSLQGKVYKRENHELEMSEAIVIDSQSEASIWQSRRKNKIVTGNVNDYGSEKEFYDTYIFDTRVEEFIGAPIFNFINFHEEDVSIIVFNKPGPIIDSDLLFIEAIVNSAFIISLMEHKKN